PALKKNDRDGSRGAPQHHSYYQVQLRPGSHPHHVDATKNSKDQGRGVSYHEPSGTRDEVVVPPRPHQLCGWRHFEVRPPDPFQLSLGSKVGTHDEQRNDKGEEEHREGTFDVSNRETASHRA